MKARFLLSLLTLLVLISASNNASSQCSIILVQDISTSMDEELPDAQRKILVSKDVIRDFINRIDFKTTEMAMTTFAGEAIGNPIEPDFTPFRMFTSDRDSMIQSVNMLSSLYAGTNWNSAFLEKKSQPYIKNLSALYYCQPEIRKYQPVIIFITDGNHLTKWGGEFRESEVRSLALQRNAKIYVLQIGSEEIDTNNTQILKQLSLIGKSVEDKTDNVWFHITKSNNFTKILEEVYSECDCGVMGVEENIVEQEFELNLYPNPTQDELTVVFPKYFKSNEFEWGSVEITIFNSMGIEVKSYDVNNLGSIDNYSFSIEELQSGIYFVGFKSKYLNEVLPLSVIK